MSDSLQPNLDDIEFCAPQTTRIAIIGLGYVGLPLAVEFAKRYEVIGYDVMQRRVDELNQNFDRTLEVSEAELKAVCSGGSAPLV